MGFFSNLFGSKQSDGVQSTDTPRKSADAWCAEGNDLGSRGQHKEAIVCLENALKVHPKHALSWFNMGLSLMNLGKKEEAIKAFTSFLNYAPPQAQALHVPTAKGYIKMLSK